MYFLKINKEKKYIFKEAVFTCKGVVPSGMEQITVGGAWDFTRTSDPRYD